MQQEFVDTVLWCFSHGEKQHAVNMLLEYVYFNTYEFGLMCKDEDTRSDFLLWLYPRMEDIISKYNPSRSLFFTYLRMTLKYYFQLFERQQYQKNAYTEVVQNEQKYEAEEVWAEQEEGEEYGSYVASPKPEYGPVEKKYHTAEDVGRRQAKKDSIFRRKLLLLACKSCFYMNDELMKHIAAATGIPVKDIQKMVEEAKRHAAHKEQTYLTLQKKRDWYYTRYKCADIQLESVAQIHASIIARLEVQRDYNYACWQKFLMKVKNYKRMPSNRELAKQFGISRTTIDNNLAVLKKP